MPRLYDWQKSETLRASLEVYDWESSLEQPSVRLRDEAEDYRDKARNWAVITGLLLGNNLGAGASFGRGLASVAVWGGIAIYNSERWVDSLAEAKNLWPEG